MRFRIFWPLLIVVASGVCATCATAAKPPAKAGKLQLMPLPKAGLGPAARTLSLDPDSGVVSNGKAADNAAGDVSAAVLARLGRVTGYSLDYTDPGGAALGAGRGLLSVETHVHLYRDAGAARKAMAFWRKDDLSIGTLPGTGVKASFTPLAVPRVGGERWGLAAVLKVKGKPAIHAVDIYFRIGDLVAFVAVGAADSRSTMPLAATLAVKLEARIRRVLAGKLTGPPVPLPAQVKAGPPASGLDLAAMTLTPKDLGAGKVTHQGYQLDPDLDPVSEYAREISGSPFPSFDEEVALFHSSTEASFALTLLANGFASSGLMQAARGGEAKADRIVSYKPTSVAVSAGDEARAVVAKVRFGDGTIVNEGFVLVRVGSALAFVTVGTPANITIPRTVMVLLSKATASRLDAGLRKTPVA